MDAQAEEGAGLKGGESEVAGVSRFLYIHRALHFAKVPCSFAQFSTWSSL